MSSVPKENRKKICLLCFGKTKRMYFIQDKLKSRIEEVFNYDEKDARLPVVICSECQRDLYRLKSGEQIRVHTTDFSIITLKKVTRSCSSVLCDCYVCQLSGARIENSKIGNLKKKILPKRKSIIPKAS